MQKQRFRQIIRFWNNKKKSTINKSQIRKKYWINENTLKFNRFTQKYSQTALLCNPSKNQVNLICLTLRSLLDISTQSKTLKNNRKTRNIDYFKKNKVSPKVLSFLLIISEQNDFDFCCFIFQMLLNTTKNDIVAFFRTLVNSIYL